MDSLKLANGVEVAIESIKTSTLKPDDIILVKVDVKDLPPSKAAHRLHMVQYHFKQYLPEGTKVLVVDNGVNVECISKDKYDVECNGKRVLHDI